MYPGLKVRHTLVFRYFFVLSNCLILSTNSVSSPTQVRLNSDPSPTGVGDDTVEVR